MTILCVRQPRALNAGLQPTRRRRRGRGRIGAQKSLFRNGINKLRDLTSNDNCPYVLWIGSKRLIKRRAFERYLETVFSV